MPVCKLSWHCGGAPHASGEPYRHVCIAGMMASICHEQTKTATQSRDTTRACQSTVCSCSQQLSDLRACPLALTLVLMLSASELASVLQAGCDFSRRPDAAGWGRAVVIRLWQGQQAARGRRCSTSLMQVLFVGRRRLQRQCRSVCLASVVGLSAIQLHIWRNCSWQISESTPLSCHHNFKTSGMMCLLLLPRLYGVHISHLRHRSICELMSGCDVLHQGSIQLRLTCSSASTACLQHPVQPTPPHTSACRLHDLYRCTARCRR
jgi:hypothetical protein